MTAHNTTNHEDELTNAEAYHYPDCWDEIAYPTILHVLDEVDPEICSECSVCGKPFGKLREDAR